MRDKGELVGQRFMPSETVVTGPSTMPVWRIQDVFGGADGRDYARLLNERDGSTQKTVAAAVLRDRSRFRPV